MFEFAAASCASCSLPLPGTCLKSNSVAVAAKTQLLFSHVEWAADDAHAHAHVLSPSTYAPAAPANLQF